MLKRLFSRPFYQNLLFIFIFLTVAYYYNYQNIFFYRPQSIHAWRQADCASITLNYYQGGMNFFKPEVHNYNSDGGTSGFCATSEIPLLYYFSALLYKIFGPHEFIIRIINTLIFFSGLFFLFKLLLYVFKDLFWAAGLSLLFFTSPVLVYYGNNYLTNVSALSFSFIGWYFVIRFRAEPKNKFLVLAFLFFFLGGAFKVTALMSLFAVAGYYIFGKVNFKHSKQDNISFKGKLLPVGILLVVGIIGIWLWYANNFNKCHDCCYFSTTIFPVWTLKFAEIKELIIHVYEFWLTDYFHPVVHLLFLFSLGLIVFKFRKADKFFLIILLFLAVQSILYMALQFWTFHDHDYYTIEQNIVPVFIIVTAFGIMKSTYKRWIDSILVKIFFAFFIVFNIHHAKAQTMDRYKSWKNTYCKEKKSIYSISPYLRQIGINQTDKIIFIPDNSNVSLFLMNQPGWTQYTDARFNRGAHIRYNQDSAGISLSVMHGAKYLIVNSKADIYLFSYVKSFCRNLAGEYEGVLIFDLTDTTKNFSIPKPMVRDTLLCDAENIIGQQFVGIPSGIKFGNGETQSSEDHFEGSYSSKLTSANSYGMTFTISEASYGESYKISVWRKGSSEAGIVANGPAEVQFYRFTSSIITKNQNSEWQKLSMELFVPQNMDGKELKIYLYNPSHIQTYFDNFEIIRYQSFEKAY